MSFLSEIRDNLKSGINAFSAIDDAFKRAYADFRVSLGSMKQTLLSE